MQFFTPLRVYPYLQDTQFGFQVICLTGFSGIRRTGYYGWGKQVQVGTVSGAITTVGKAITIAQQVNHKKQPGYEKFLPQLQEMFYGWAKEYPPTMKKLPVDFEVPELLENWHSWQEQRKSWRQLGIIFGLYFIIFWVLGNTWWRSLVITPRIMCSLSSRT